MLLILNALLIIPTKTIASMWQVAAAAEGHEGGKPLSQIRISFNKASLANALR